MIEYGGRQCVDAGDRRTKRRIDSFPADACEPRSIDTVHRLRRQVFRDRPFFAPLRGRFCRRAGEPQRFEREHVAQRIFTQMSRKHAPDRCIGEREDRAHTQADMRGLRGFLESNDGGPEGAEHRSGDR